MQCRNCKSEYQEIHNFCPSCGTPKNVTIKSIGKSNFMDKIKKFGLGYVALSLGMMGFISFSKMPTTALYYLLAAIYVSLILFRKIPNRLIPSGWKHISLSVFAFFLIGGIISLIDFMPKSSQSANITKTENYESQVNEPNSNKVKKELAKENVCKQDLGTYRINSDAKPLGKNTPFDVMHKYLKSDTCDVIELTYIYSGKYDPMPFKVKYSRITQKLTEIYTETNVKNEYTGVSVSCLTNFLKEKHYSFEYLTSCSDVKYDFNNREMKSNAGPKPKQSEWDGSVDIVERYIKGTAKDAGSIEFIEWSQLSDVGDSWTIRCKYSGTNSYGARVTENKWYFIKDGEIIRTK